LNARTAGIVVCPTPSQALRFDKGRAVTFAVVLLLIGGVANDMGRKAAPQQATA